MAKHAAAQNLFDRVVSNDVGKVEEFLGLGDSIIWRELIRYEFDLQAMRREVVAEYPLLLKLLAYDIRTISSFHLAAMLGFDDILMALMEKDVPVDIAIVSGSTALHLACFAGNGETVQLLTEVYKADLSRTDGYGWSALHYACTEGHLKIVELLLSHNMDVCARDKDGTTSAYRAQVNGHNHIVKYLQQLGCDDDLLNIENAAEDSADDVSALYTKVNKTKSPVKTPECTVDEAESCSDATEAPQANGSALKSNTELGMFGSAPAELNRSTSEDSALNSYRTAPKPAKRTSKMGNNSGMSRSKTLPSKYKNNPPHNPQKKETIRRIIRKELELSFGSEYETPVDPSKSTIWEEEELKDIGVKTLTGLMREEFEKYKLELQPPVPPMEREPPVKNSDDSAYEDLYASLANLPEAPPSPLDVPGAPPLPPRNPMTLTVRNPGKESSQDTSKALTLTSQQTDNPALTESFLLMAPMLGKDWKKLAHALPLEDKPTKVDHRISAIEKESPKSVTDQALRSLTEWRVKKGKDANVDALIIALRKCKLSSLIPTVEKATQEFTA